MRRPLKAAKNENTRLASERAQVRGCLVLPRQCWVSAKESERAARSTCKWAPDPQLTFPAVLRRCTRAAALGKTFIQKKR